MEKQVKLIGAVFVSLAALFGVLKGCQEYRKASSEQQVAKLKQEAAEAAAKDEAAKRQAALNRPPAGGTVPAPKGSSPAPPDVQPEVPVAKWVPERVRGVDPVTGLGYEMHLRSARVAGTELACELTLVATKERKSLNFGRVANSTVTFDTGDQAKVKGVAWGGKVEQFFTIAHKELEPNVPYKIELTFDPAPASAKRISALTFQFEYGVRGPETLTVRDIELQRKVYK